MKFIEYNDTIVNLDEVCSIGKSQSMPTYDIKFFFPNHIAIMQFNSISMRDKKFKRLNRILGSSEL